MLCIVKGLANPNLKLRRAKEHLDTLEVEIRSFVEAKPHTTTSYDDLGTDEYLVQIQFQGPGIWPIGAIFGDFICCLRSSLDHLMYGLVTANGGEPTTNTAFPIISIYRGQPSEDRFTNAVRGVPDGARAIVQSLQPYNSGNAHELTHLARLDKLWNIDKHRHIRLDAAACDIEFPKVPRTLRKPTVSIIDDKAVVRFPMAAKPYANFDPVSKVFVRFGSEKAGIVVTIENLRDIYEFVAENVIPRFKGFFPE